MRRAAMSHRLRRHALHVAAVAVLLTQAASALAADDKPTPLPTEVAAAQKRYARWIAAFNAWRGAASASPSEAPREAAVRKVARLLVVPTPMPRLSTQRRIDGHAIVVSLGLIDLLDELLLAEAMPPGCFNDYAQDVGRVLTGNHDAARAYAQALSQATAQAKDDKGRPVRALPAAPLKAWPRLSARVDAGDLRGRCAAVKPAALRSAATQAWLEDNADSLALWLLTHQAAVLAADAAIESPTPKSAATRAPDPLPSPTPSPAKAACLAEIDAAAKAAAAAVAASATVPTPPPSLRARLALCTTDRPELQTLKWMQENLGFLGEG